MAASTQEQKAKDIKELPTIDNGQVSKKWDGMAKWYSKMANQFMAPTTASLIPHLQLNAPNNDTGDNKEDKDAFRLLDVATGDGFNSVRIIKELISAKPNGFEYYGIDISQEMINYTNDTIQNDILLSTFLKNSDISDKYKINVSVQNGEDLDNFKDNTFDRYLSSLCLMLTGNALTMLKESYRILKPNGISAWSIWGDKSRGLVFESLGPILKPIKEELGIETTVTSGYATRTNYYLADDMENTVKLFKSVGYKTVFYWSVDVPFPINTAKQWSDYYQTGPLFTGLLNKCEDDQQKEKIIKMLEDGMKQRFKELVQDQNKAITHNNVCIVAVK